MGEEVEKREVPKGGEGMEVEEEEETKEVVQMEVPEVHAEEVEKETEAKVEEVVYSVIRLALWVDNLEEAVLAGVDKEEVAKERETKVEAVVGAVQVEEREVGEKVAREAQARGVDLEVGVVEEVEKDKGEEDFWEETLVVEEMVEEYLGVAGEHSEHQLELLVGMKEEEG